MTSKRKKVICAMSGGVDSSVAAALLKKKGYEVVGVFMKFWREAGKGRENRCCSMEAQAGARRVAAKLKIPFYSINVAKEFKKRVVDYFIEEYKKGRTPNPCIECNRWIKFRFLIEKALQLKAGYIATGHYARVKNGKLLTAKDIKKDQSYFLWTLNQKQLKKILFPIGDYTKKEVRQMAKKWNLPNSERAESQEICFITTSIEDFLKKYLKSKPGNIITTDGKKISEHKGLIFYTIGQRKGIRVGGIGPFYVVEKDFKNNALIVAQSDFNEALFKKEFTVSKANWINKPKKFPLKCKAKIRYMAPASPATIKGNKVIFTKNQRAITPGQSVVFYLQDEILGGGIIK